MHGRIRKLYFLILCDENFKLKILIKGVAPKMGVVSTNCHAGHKRILSVVTSLNTYKCVEEELMRMNGYLIAGGRGGRKGTG